MTTEPRFERQLPTVLEDLYLGPSPDYRDDVLAAATAVRQRPAWTFPGRWLPMDLTTRLTPVPRLPWRQLGILALIALLLATALAVYVGSQRHLPAPFGPARNGLIPYISNGDIYAGDPLTGKTKLLLAGADKDFAPMSSPDGTRIAFLRSTGPDWPDGTPRPVDMYTMREDGSNVVKVTPTPIGQINWGIWSADSHTLAVTYQDGAWSRLIVLDADGKKPAVKITAATNPDYVEFRPPDGRELLFRGKEKIYPDDRFGLYVLDLATMQVRTLSGPSTDNYDDDNAPVYSADGSRIFYSRWFKDSIQLWVMNADGSNAHRFVGEAGYSEDHYPVVSPDGRWVAFDHHADGAAIQRLAVVRADGTGPITLVGPGFDSGGTYVWSPDSTRILEYPFSPNPTNPYLVDPQGGPMTKVPWVSDADLDWQRTAF
jgi:Tol biopolymer transport system component